jgi:hypothetical protein
MKKINIPDIIKVIISLICIVGWCLLMQAIIKNNIKEELQIQYNNELIYQDY